MASVVLVREHKHKHLLVDWVRVAKHCLPAICHMEHLLRGLGVNAPQPWVKLRSYIRNVERACWVTATSMVRKMQAIDHKLQTSDSSPRGPTR